MSLSKLCDDIVAMAKVDCSCQEIIDIGSAVEEMLENLVSGEIVIKHWGNYKYRKPLKFRNCYLQPCGSMAERTSLWKSAWRQGRENKYIEFDYLAILDNKDGLVDIARNRCKGCRRISCENKLLSTVNFSQGFLEALYTRISKMCSCCVDPEGTNLEIDRRGMTCESCTVHRDTGYLKIAKIPDFSQKSVKEREHCSLVLYWTSHEETLLAPNVDTLMPTEKIKRLVIRIDLLPAFEYPGNGEDQSGTKRLIITKTCPYCHNLESFMVSFCKYEFDTILHVSEKHRHSFITIKFLYGQIIYWTGGDDFMNSYHAKVAFITHCQTCSDDCQDCASCITEILQSLVDAYTSWTLKLPKFHRVKTLRLKEKRSDDDRDVGVHCFKIHTLCLLHVMSHLKTRKDKQCSSQYQPCDIVGLIKRTCRMLYEGGQPGIMEVDGGTFENTVPAVNIIDILLEDKDLCYYAMHEGVDYVEKKLCHRLPCPDSERALMCWRAVCIAKMILASDTTNIRDEMTKKVAELQVYVKMHNELMYGSNKLQFLTISQTVPEVANNGHEQASYHTSLDQGCLDTSAWRIHSANRILVVTNDLQINWIAVTEELKSKVVSEETELHVSADDCLLKADEQPSIIYQRK